MNCGREIWNIILSWIHNSEAIF